MLLNSVKFHSLSKLAIALELLGAVERPLDPERAVRLTTIHTVLSVNFQAIGCIFIDLSRVLLYLTLGQNLVIVEAGIVKEIDLVPLGIVRLLVLFISLAKSSLRFARHLLLLLIFLLVFKWIELVELILHFLASNAIHLLLLLPLPLGTLVLLDVRDQETRDRMESPDGHIWPVLHDEDELAEGQVLVVEQVLLVWACEWLVD